MNTLSKTITRTFFQTETGYQELEARWRERLASGTTLHGQDYLLYQLLRGKDYRKAFTPPTHPAKVANGHRPYLEQRLYGPWSFLFFRAPNRYQPFPWDENLKHWLKPYQDLLAEDITEQLRVLIPTREQLDTQAYVDPTPTFSEQAAKLTEIVIRNLNENAVKDPAPRVAAR
jgi:hypothetical protein